jgi:hypothetical protein
MRTVGPKAYFDLCRLRGRAREAAQGGIGSEEFIDAELARLVLKHPRRLSRPGVVTCIQNTVNKRASLEFLPLPFAIEVIDDLQFAELKSLGHVPGGSGLGRRLLRIDKASETIAARLNDRGQKLNGVDQQIDNASKPTFEWGAAERYQLRTLRWTLVGSAGFAACCLPVETIAFTPTTLDAVGINVANLSAEYARDPYAFYAGVSLAVTGAMSVFTVMHFVMAPTMSVYRKLGPRMQLLCALLFIVLTAAFAATMLAVILGSRLAFLNPDPDDDSATQLIGWLAVALPVTVGLLLSTRREVQLQLVAALTEQDLVHAQHSSMPVGELRRLRRRHRYRWLRNATAGLIVGAARRWLEARVTLIEVVRAARVWRDRVTAGKCAAWLKLARFQFELADGTATKVGQPQTLLPNQTPAARPVWTNGNGHVEPESADAENRR